MSDYDDKADAEDRDYGRDQQNGFHEARIDELNQIIDGLKARIAELEAMGPLIEEYGVVCTENGMYDANQAECDAMLAEIKRILKGGA